MDLISRRTLLAGAAALGAVGYPAAARPAGSNAATQDIDVVIGDALRAHGCPGVSVAVARDGVFLLSRGYGFANLETRSPVTERTVFRIGSLTKQFTAAAVIKLASQGRLDIKAPAATYLPALSKLPPFSLVELMNHTAGLHSDDGSGAPAPQAKTQVQLAADIAAQATPFDFDPGTAWLYSNANYIVLGAVVESTMSKPLAQAMAELIFTPLGLTSLAFDQVDASMPDRASGYSPTDKPGVTFEKAAYIDVAAAAQAQCEAMLRTCAGGTKRCLAPSCLIGIMSISCFGQAWRDGRLSGANRFSAADANYGDVQYACGLLVSGPGDLHPNIMHYGFINGFAAVLQTYLDPRVSFAVLCNADTNPDLPFRGVRKAVVAGYLGAA